MTKKQLAVSLAIAILAAGAGTALGTALMQQKNHVLAQEAENLKTLQTRSGSVPNLKPETDGWLITQYGDLNLEQEMCYTITTDTGLVIVDGGQPYEAERLRTIIAQYDNQVAGWILTHPHSDHISAFMDIYDDSQGIQIEKVYVARFPDEALMKENASWDDYGALERFRGMNIPELEYIETGDCFELLGMQVEILSAYRDSVDEISDDLMNDGSIVFRVRGKEDSMLFCADVGKHMTEELKNTYGENLKSDYVQMGHHGFGGPGRSFYELVDPTGAFFDAPGWLMESDTDRSTKKKEKQMREIGSMIFTYYTTPNQILLR